VQNSVAITAQADALFDLIHRCPKASITRQFMNLSMIRLDDVVEI
jgi:hypothetical protein